MVNSHAGKRLLLAKCSVAKSAAITLHNPILIFESPEFLCLSMTAVTVHLTFRGQDLNFACISRYASGRSMACWLRPVGARHTGGAFVLICYTSQSVRYCFTDGNSVARRLDVTFLESSSRQPFCFLGDLVSASPVPVQYLHTDILPCAGKTI